MSEPERIPAPKIDWARIVADLLEHHCSGYRVRITLGVADCTVRNWMKGGEPGYGYGRALLRLHSRICGAALTTRRVEEGEVEA